ncbi:MAG: nucleotidyltransferase family protein [Magnetospirillum sp.]|nr:nucleotidyltransferase family protein [Magnetospirillum sp.]
MRRLEDIIDQLRALQPELRRRYPIRSMGVFGSFVRGEQREDSDLDVLVEFGDEAGLFEYAGLQLDLCDALGMKVDVANKAALRPRIGQRILAEVRML